MADSRDKTYNVTCTTEDAEYVLYTCPAACRAKMNLLYVTNTGSASTDLSIEWDRADGSHAHILGAKNISSTDFIQWSNGYIVFEPGDRLLVTPSGASTPHVDALCTVEEVFQNSRS